MNQINERLKPLGIQTTSILIPLANADKKKWAVIACDQYSSEPEYWKSVEKTVKDSPSSLNLVFPECYLDKGNNDEIIANINSTMNDYLNQDLFETVENSFILIDRKLRSGKSRWGLMAALDLDQYDFNKGSKSLIRATEGTIVERIPPRLKIRKDAVLELPHIMVLIDDKKAPLIQPLIDSIKDKTPLYQTELMEDSGSLTGYKISNSAVLSSFADSVEKLADTQAFKKQYNKEDLLLFAIGDGNHSLATAKTQWETIKASLSETEQENHPARFALVELNSIYDAGIDFEPIHRVLFKANSNQFIKDFTQQFNVTLSDVSQSELTKLADSIPNEQQFIIITDKGFQRLEIQNPDTNLTAGTFQNFADKWLEEQSGCEIDYIHGVESTLKLGSEAGNFGIILPNISKSTFFETVIEDGSFPRKTFSMGEAHEKRFYYEARKITL